MLLLVLPFAGCASDKDKEKDKEKNPYTEWERKQNQDEDDRFFYSNWLNPKKMDDDHLADPPQGIAGPPQQ